MVAAPFAALHACLSTAIVPLRERSYTVPGIIIELTVCDVFPTQHVFFSAAYVRTPLALPLASLPSAHPTFIAAAPPRTLLLLCLTPLLPAGQ